MGDRGIEQYRKRLREWDFDEGRALGVEANVANFRNGLRDMYDEAFPWVRDKKKKKDEVKPWLDNAGCKALVRKKGILHFNKIKGRWAWRGHIAARRGSYWAVMIKGSRALGTIQILASLACTLVCRLWNHNASCDFRLLKFIQTC